MILQTGNPLLRQKAKPVEKKDIASARLRTIISRMRKALAAEDNGVAIAAPQIGVPLRIFLIAKRGFGEENTSKPPRGMIFINPELLRLSKRSSEMSEGCLSVRGSYGIVLRHEKATVKALDEHGKPFTYHGSGLIAQIFQHEIEHLNGVLYTDKALLLRKEPESAPKKQQRE